MADVIMYTTSAATATTSTAETHRHGCRTGIALIASGRGPGEVPNRWPEVISLTGRLLLLSAPQGSNQYDGTQLAPIELLLFSATSVLAIAPSVTDQFVKMVL